MPWLKELIGPMERGSLDNQSGVDLVDDLLHCTLRVQFFMFESFSSNVAITS